MTERTIIAGPCSAESEEQVLGTAGLLRGAEWFRAGLWKPRTMPGRFEGVGSEGLAWLVRVRQEFGLKVCTEVVGGASARECLEAGLDGVWIGARTTSNPFLVQEIADAIGGSPVRGTAGSSGGSPVRVMVKNPAEPNLEAWCGAIERLRAAGVQDIVAVHRGFSSSAHSQYRNSPEWELALGLRARYPFLPIVCDPSHIAGKASLVEEIALKALRLGADGLMVEVHENPSAALSDAAQQLCPEQFEELLLKVSRIGPVAGSEEGLAALRSEIDALDEQLLAVLSRRLDVCARIGELKKKGSLSVVQEQRWASVLESARRLGERYGLDPSAVERIFGIIHEMSVARQNSVLLEE